MSDFYLRLNKAAELLATGEGNVKHRLARALTEELVFANVPNDDQVPRYFRDKQRQIISRLSVKQWSSELTGDCIRATIHPMRFARAASYAREIWQLYEQFEDYRRTGVAPVANISSET